MSSSIKLRKNDDINNSDYMTKLKNQIDESNKLLDNIINETYNYEFNVDNKNNNDIDDLQNNEISLNDVFIEDINRVSKQLDKTIINTLDSERNQEHMNKFISAQQESIIKKNKNVLTDLEESNKKLLVNYFYYKKNKIQVKIMYYLLIVIFALLSLSYLNKYFKVIMNDTLYIILSASLILVYLLYFCFNVYDLYARSDVNIDEYDFNSYTSASIDGINSADDSNSAIDDDLINKDDLDITNNKCVNEYIKYFDKDNVIKTYN